MAEVKKARLFLRRGTDTDRIATTLCEGELGYSTDAFRVVVGDGTTAGGISLGATVFVSAGSLARHFHTKLTTASAGGLAHTGDLAIFPALAYQNVSGGTVSPGASATTVMLLTGSSPSDSTSWVAINSGIPWGNLSVSADDISGDKIHGGDVSGDVTFSGTISTTSVTATSAFVRGLLGAGNRSVLVTAAGQLTATEADNGPVLADGTLRWVSFQSISSADSGKWTSWRHHQFNGTIVPYTATTGLFQFVWHEAAGAGVHDILMVSDDNTSSTPLTAVYEGAQADVGDGNGGSQQFYCPLSSNGIDAVAFKWEMLDQKPPYYVNVFNGGFDFRLIGYM